MRTYYIVEEVSARGEKEWRAYKRGILSTFNRFWGPNYVMSTLSYDGPDDCETNLRRVLDPVKPKVVRVVKI